MGLFKQKEKRKKIAAAEVAAHPKRWSRQRQVKTAAGVKVAGVWLCQVATHVEDAAKAALEELNMDTTIDHVTDFAQIAAYGVMTTPALVVDGKVVSYGKVLKKDEAKALIQKVRG